MTVSPPARLHTLVFFPDLRKHPPTGEKVGTVLFRTPYNASYLSTEENVSTQLFPFVLDPGLAVVLQDVRGCGKLHSAAVGCTSGTNGRFDFPNTSGTDGYDTVDWIVKQPWSNGKVALNGKSALAIDSYELITMAPHPSVKAVSLQLGEMTGHQQWYPGGAYRLGMAEIYLSTLAGLDEGISSFYPPTFVYMDNPYRNNE